jgi:uncharacterized membrane protein YphA (DoxX/SURF4 family)
MQFIFGVFIILHGLVHLLYFGQSARRFELRPGMTWPDGSWAFSKILGDKTTRTLASVACVVAAILFVAGGAGVLIGQSWGPPISVAAAVFSTVTFIVFWNGKLRTVSDQGGVGILIDLAILVAVLVLHWPPL